MKPVLLDSSVIVALLDRSQPFHEACADALQNLRGPLFTCEAVIVESCHLLRNLEGAREAVLDNVATGMFQVPFQISQQAASVRALLRKYRDHGMDLADACLVVLANEYETADILTLDSDFRIYRWGRNRPFRMLPGSS
jgi:uncharacterized protein